MVMSVNEKMTAIADAIRDKTGGTEPLTLDNMATEIPKVYEEGKKVERDEFWDNYQINGTRKFYPYAFGGTGWYEDTFKPKYPMAPEGSSGCEGMFYYFARRKSYDNDMVDFTEISQILDFSQCTRATNTFRNACVKNLYCDFSNCTQLSNTFNTDSGGRADFITLRVSEKLTSCSGTFNYASGLTELRFTEDSTIAANINVQWSTLLNKASHESIINALSTTTSGLTVTFSKTAVNNAFETAEGLADGSTSAAWQNLIATKSNWTISLV